MTLIINDIFDKYLYDGNIEYERFFVLIELKYAMDSFPFPFILKTFKTAQEAINEKLRILEKNNNIMEENLIIEQFCFHKKKENK